MLRVWVLVLYAVHVHLVVVIDGCFYWLSIVQLRTTVGFALYSEMAQSALQKNKPVNLANIP